MNKQLTIFLIALSVIMIIAPITADNAERLWNVQVQWYTLQGYNGYTYDVVYPSTSVLTPYAEGPAMLHYLENTVGVDIFNTTSCPTTNWISCSWNPTPPTWQWSWCICDNTHRFTTTQGR